MTELVCCLSAMLSVVRLWLWSVVCSAGPMLCCCRTLETVERLTKQSEPEMTKKAAQSDFLQKKARGYRSSIKQLTVKTTTTTPHPFNGPFSGTTQVSRYQKGKTNLGFSKARDSEWQWHQLGHMQVCTLLQTDNHTSTPSLCFLQAGCPSCRPTNSIKALKAT